MLSIEQTLDVAEKLVYHYSGLLLPYLNDYIAFRTKDMFARVVFDEIELYFKGNKQQSSLNVATEFGVAKMISDIYITFIRPLYDSHFKHNQSLSEDKDVEAKRRMHKNKCVSINLEANEEFLI
jgi:hypothetical protein